MRSDGAVLAGTGQLTAGREELGACGMCGLLTTQEGVCLYADECVGRTEGPRGSGYVDGTSVHWTETARSQGGIQADHSL